LWLLLLWRLAWWLLCGLLLLLRWLLLLLRWLLLLLWGRLCLLLLPLLWARLCLLLLLWARLCLLLLPLLLAGLRLLLLLLPRPLGRQRRACHTPLGKNCLQEILDYPLEVCVHEGDYCNSLDVQVWQVHQQRRHATERVVVADCLTIVDCLLGFLSKVVHVSTGEVTFCMGMTAGDDTCDDV
jgi:hypothetical protein